MSDGATDIVSPDYAYGDGINLTAVNDNVTSANNLGLGYSPANRLSSDSGPWGTSGWQYDATGNRIVETLGASTRVFGYPSNSNRIASETLNGALVTPMKACPHLPIAFGDGPFLSRFAVEGKLRWFSCEYPFPGHRWAKPGLSSVSPLNAGE